MIIQNADSIEIKLNTTDSRFYFPIDSPIVGKYINRLELFGGDLFILNSPTGKFLLDNQDAQLGYLSLFDSNGKIMFNNIMLNSLSSINQTHFKVYNKLSLNNCFVFLPTPNISYSQPNSSILLNAYYSTCNNNFLYSKINVAQISIDNGDDGLHFIGLQSQFKNKKIIRVEALKPTQALNGYLTLINFDTRVINNIPLQRLISNPKYENNLFFEPLENIDWENSFIHTFPSNNSFNPSTITFNVYYYE